MSLTPRQRQIAELVAKELTTKEIASVVQISRRTVEAHVYEAANRIPVSERIPAKATGRARLRLWFFNLSAPDKAA